MIYEKTPEGQTLRAIELIGHALEAANQPLDAAAEYDVAKDRVIVVVGGKPIAELGPRDWHDTDDNVRQKLHAAVLNSFGPRRS